MSLGEQQSPNTIFTPSFIHHPSHFMPALPGQLSGSNMEQPALYHLCSDSWRNLRKRKSRFATPQAFTDKMLHYQRIRQMWRLML
jgi:hypothetical protein